ncbi:3'-5' exonuclease [Rhodococcus qingshengii]|uniref:DNA 3'-5' helicase n=2 Tax=Bacteria TaxID=2 RepID=A0AAW6LCA5_RHOSG|nr:3'-5' exonuclease [Rhodococcus qingshengii]MDE8643408.1 3'-5' exonuclease [Rhodococcus qingshengii]
MPQIVIGRGLDKIDGSLHKATYAFLAKLSANDDNKSLHIEPINNSADPRARTGRVDLSNRAVLFKVQGSGQDASYVFIGTYPHDEAIKIAQTQRMAVNPRNGIAELLPVENAAPAPVYSAPVAVSENRTPSIEQSLRRREFTAEDLTELGLDLEFASGALDINDPDALLEYAETAPATWQGTALVDIFTGTSLADVKEKYALDTVESDDGTEDDKLLRALRHPAARMEFAFIEDNDELREAIERPDFAAWRIFLHPEQRAYAFKDINGPFRLTGGAGTGKTVVLLHRARELHRKNPTARIVLTTYGATLAESLRAQFRQLDSTVTLAADMGKPGVYIAGVDAIASRVLHKYEGQLGGGADVNGAVATVLGPRTAQVFKNQGFDAWKQAIGAYGADLPNELKVDSFFEAEYSLVVLPNSVTTREEYLRVKRSGRGVSLNRSKRNAVWDVIAGYRASGAASGSTDFDEKAAIAAAVLRDGSSALADHVLVDESQDLSPSRFQLLRALASEGKNDLFFAEDTHQRIYGQRVVLGRYGINIVGRSRRLTLNYRTTEQNLRYALGILSGAEFTDLGDLPETSEGYRSARSGPKPQQISVSNLTEQYDVVAKLVKTWTAAGTDAESIGLLVPTKKEGQALPRALGERETSATFVDRNSSGAKGTPQVMTMHRAKGMEFAKVVLVGVGENSIPRSYVVDSLPEGERDDALQRERSLLYVAATRARDNLVVVWTGKPSALLPEIG